MDRHSTLKKQSSSKASPKTKALEGHPRMLFPSEALLRHAITELLSRIPSVTLVQETHGSQEVGKDIVFYETGGLGEKTLCACVVKNALLSGKSSVSKAGVLTILNQVEQSLLNPKKMEYGMEIPIQKVYVITPYNLSDSTLNAVFGHLRDRKGTIEFVGGTRLFELFRKYWPEFLADEFTVIRDHLRSTTVRLQDERALQQVAINYRIGAPDRTIARYYVPPNFHQRLEMIIFDPVLALIVPERFAKVTFKRIGKDGREEWIPVEPVRLRITSYDVDDCKSSRERLASILDFLVAWNYCEPAPRDHLLSDFSAYAELLESLREKHTKVEPTDINYTTRTLSKKSMAAELTAQETREVLQYARILRQNLDKALATIARDLTIAAELIQDESVVGVKSLNDNRYPIAVKMMDMYSLAPAGLFIHQTRPIDANSEQEPKEYEGSTSFFRARLIEFPNNFLDIFSSSVLIVGAAGYGKTSFCRWNALNDAERYANSATDRVPAYFPLHEIGRGDLRSFEEMFLEYVGHSALVPKNDSSSLNMRQPIRLYLDGLDEIPNSETRRSLIELVRSGLGKWPNVQAIVTARDYIVGPWLSWLPKFNLSKFTHQQLQQLLGNWFDLQPERIAAFNDQVGRTSALEDVLSVPLLATLVILVFRLTGNLPSTRKRLYEIFVELLNAGWDVAKGVQRGSRFGPVPKFVVLKRLAYAAHEKRLRQFSESLVKPHIRSSLSGERTSQAWIELLEDMLQDGLLVRSGSTYSFAHLSFQEFLAAMNLIGDPGSQRRTRILKQFMLGDNWWKEVLSFYLELSSNLKELHDWITRVAADIDGGMQNTATSQSRVLLAHIKASFPHLAM